MVEHEIISAVFINMKQKHKQNKPIKYVFSWSIMPPPLPIFEELQNLFYSSNGGK